MEKEEELFIPKTKHKGLKIILAVILIAGLAVGGYFLYQYKFNNPRVIVNKILDTAKANIDEMLTKANTNETYHVNGHIETHTDLKSIPELVNIIRDLELQFNGEINNTAAKLTINTKYKGDKLIDLDTYYEDKNAYVLLNDVYDKYLKLDINEIGEETPVSNEIKADDIKLFYDAIIDAFKKEIENVDIKKEDAKIKVDEKELEVVNNYIELKDKEVNTFAKGIITSLLNNTKFVEVLSKLSGENGKNELNDLLDDINEEEYEGVYKIGFYTSKGLFNKDLVSMRQDILQKDNIVSTYLDKISDEEILVTIHSDEDAKVTFRVRANKSTINLVIREDAAKEGSLEIDISMNYEKVNGITKPDVSTSKEMSELSEEEFDKIQSKIWQNKNLQKLMEDIRKAFTPEA